MPLKLIVNSVIFLKERISSSLKAKRELNGFVGFVIVGMGENGEQSNAVNAP
jgi:hypothetical protein